MSKLHMYIVKMLNHIYIHIYRVNRFYFSLIKVMCYMNTPWLSTWFQV